MRSSSSSHALLIVAGPADLQGDEYDHTHLHVPNNVTSLVGMQFDPAAGRCQMRALFRTTAASNSNSSSVLVTYPPSQVQIVSQNPVFLPVEYTLEGVAQQELERIEKLSFRSHCGVSSDAPDAAAAGSTARSSTTATMDDTLQAVDTRFLQYLFRPSFPRGNGSVLPPATAHIRAAMHKLGGSSSNTTNNNSIEVDVVRFIQEWRRRERHHQRVRTPVPRRREEDPDSNRRTYTGSSSAAVDALSVYDSLDIQDEEEAVAVEQEEDVLDDADMDLVHDEQEVQEHERRWRLLLMEIVKEEYVDRAPVSMFIATNITDAAVVVRPACISAISFRSGETPMTPLDAAAMELLSRIVSQGTYRSELELAESYAMECLGHGQMALEPDHARTLKRSLMACCALDPAGPLKQRIDNLRDTSPDQLGAMVRRTPLGCSLPGLCLLSPTESSMGAPRRPVLGTQSRLAAANLFVRAADSARRLHLGRFLVLCEIRSSAADTAFLMYLHSLNVMSVSARTVPFPPMTSTLDLPPLQLGQSASSSSPSPPKRSKVSSVLDTPNKTVAVDSLLIQLSQRVVGAGAMTTTTTTTSGSFTGLLSALGSAAMDLCFQVAATEYAGRQQMPPELGLLFLQAGEIDKHSAPLVLRLLAPTVAVPLPHDPDVAVESRTELMAKCLLLASLSESPKKAEAMVSRAFALLPFDVSDIEKSMKNLAILEDRIGGNPGFAGRQLLNYINQAIDQMSGFDGVESNRNFSSLCSRRFNVALAVRDWETAHAACLKHPNATSRAGDIKRFVRALVDAGSLSILLDKCSAVEGDAEAFHGVNDLYSVAVETLTDSVFSDIYSFGPETASDYLGALYSLHVSRGDWKSAAQALDMRYARARQSLATPAPNLSAEEQAQRERLSVDDLVLGAVGSYRTMTLVTDTDTAYLISGKKSLYPSIPVHALGKHGGIKHSREGNQRVAEHNSAVEGEQYMNLDDLQLRAVKCNALKALFADDLEDPTFAKLAVDSKDISNIEIIDKLFGRGYYHDGLMLTAALAKIEDGKPGGWGVFRDSLNRLICDYLVPLALDRKHVPERPTIRQLQAGMESLGESGESPVLLCGSRSKKARDLARSEIRVGAMNFIRLLTIKYTSAEQPFALDLAAEMLKGHRPATALPSWLEQLAVFGTNHADLPGLFARRRAPGVEGFLGDPACLLNLYTARGMYKEACRVVSTVLAGPNNDYRESKAPSRLPERGEIDFLPHNKIDILWNLIQLAVNKGRADAPEILQARSQMEESLTKYFDLLQISDMGAQSARALS